MATSTTPTDILDALDFDPTCEQDCPCHGTCQDNAEYTARTHWCGEIGGRLILLCSTHLADFTAGIVDVLNSSNSHTAQCEKCHQRFTTVEQIIWDACPIG